MLIRSWLFTIAVALAAPMAAVPRAQQGYDLYQQALVKERAAGELDAAIALYDRIAKEFAADRALAAKALMRMAGCYDQLGSPEAARIYARVASQFADQTELAAEARRRLKPPAPAPAIVTPPPGLVRKIREPLGRLANTPPGFVSPTGRHVAIVAGSNISVREIATGQTRQLTTSTPDERACGQLAWSRDGSTLAFNWCLSSGSTEVRAIDIARGTTRTLVPKSASSVIPLDWSPDGRSLLALFRSRPAPGSSELAVVSLADGRIRPVKSGPDATTPWPLPRAASFSPDGQSIVFTPDSEDRGLHVLTIETGEERPLFPASRHELWLGWTPAGNLLFTSDRSGTYDLWMVGFADGRAQGVPGKLVSDIGVITANGLTDTGALYFLTDGMRPTANADLYLATVDPSTGKAIGSALPVSRAGVGHLTHPVWSPTGRELAYKVGAAGTVGDIYIQTIDTGQERRLDAPLGAVAQFDWSPDGRSLIVARILDGVAQIVRIEFQNSAVTIVVSPPSMSVSLEPSPGQGDLSQPRWLRDSRSILFVSNSKVQRVDVGAAVQRTVLEATQPIRSFVVSPDSSMVAYTAGRTVMVGTLNDGRSRPLVDTTDSSSARRVTWSADGRFVIYSSRTAAATVPGTTLAYDELWRIPAAGGDAERMNVAADSIFQPAMSPDGRYLAFSVNSDARSSLLVLDGFLPTAELRRR